MSTHTMDQQVTRAACVRRGRLPEYLTVGWNLLEGVVAVGSGLIAGSAALVGFGFDSFIESLSGLTLLWRLRSDENAEQREAQYQSKRKHL